MNANCRERTDCRCCHSTDLVEVFDLGEQPAANALIDPEKADNLEPVWPLTLMECRTCGMVQLKHVVDRELLFRDYAFQTSSSERMVAHFAELMHDACDQFVPRNGLIVEVGSNDGSSLASITRRDVRRVGVDPAENLVIPSIYAGVQTIPEFFNKTSAYAIAQKFGSADCIVSCNVLGHVDDLDEFMSAADYLLMPHGALIIEVPNFDEFFIRAEWDTIYHEHLSYFRLAPLAALLQRHGFWMTNVTQQNVHGGSFRVVAQRGYDERNFTFEKRDWKEFRAEVAYQVSELREYLGTKKSQGFSLCGYGAPAKATVRLNRAMIGIDMLPCIFDTSPGKQGKLIPGTHQPIYHPNVLNDMPPDKMILFSWNHQQEIIEKLKPILDRGTTLHDVCGMRIA